MDYVHVSVDELHVGTVQYSFTEVVPDATVNLEIIADMLVEPFHEKRK